MRKCSHCKQEKAATEFYATNNICKPCHRIRDRLRGTTRSPKNATREGTPAALARKRRYQAKGLHPEARRARRLVRTAIEAGKLTRPEACELCGDHAKRRDGVTAIQAHHDDYAKPLVVRWLCILCHSAWHRENDAAIAAQAAQPAQAVKPATEQEMPK